MDAFVLVSLTLLMISYANGSESIQSRGFDENPWSSMNQQPEVLIVKEKGGGAPSKGSGMKMKDLTPIICLLAPLLLAAIMLPAKMTMNMNGMLGNNGMMVPALPLTMMPMMPMMPNFPIGNSLPLTALLTNGMGSTNNPFGLPIFKDSFMSKMFPENVSRHGDTNNDTRSTEYASNMIGNTKESYDRDLFFVTNPASEKNSFVKMKKKAKVHRKSKGDVGKNEWVSRVWSEKKDKITLAEEIVKLFDDILSLV